ncbi:hypothetical protein [Kitasatospora sp. NPDC087315]|uniref:hypothetical protein n=1 Tax=Kitasatospora sp. NPDC087315 TaxID=3364069 RepID=UPI00380B4BAF
MSIGGVRRCRADAESGRDLGVVLIEGLLDGVRVGGPANVEFFRAKFRQVAAEAMSVDASLRFISDQRGRFKA